MSVLVKADGTVQGQVGEPSLEQAQKLVGGYVEVVRVDSFQITLLVDEEGRLKDKPVNQFISDRFGVLVVGDVIVIHGKSHWNE